MTHAFSTTPRVRLSQKERLTIFFERGGICYLCTRKLGPKDEWQIEHPHALMNGGKESQRKEVVCGWCHPPKTAADHKQAKKTRDIAKRHWLPKSQRPSKFRRPEEGTRWDWSRGPRLVRDK